MLDWSPADLLAAVTSIADELDACAGCGLRDDQLHHVEADLRRCPGCEARARTQDKMTKGDAGVHVAFYPVADTRDSVWALYTADGKQWAAAHRRDDGLVLHDPADPDS